MIDQNKILNKFIQVSWSVKRFHITKSLEVIISFKLVHWSAFLILTCGLIGCAGTAGGGKKGEFRYYVNLDKGNQFLGGSGVLSLSSFREISYQVLEGQYQYTILPFRKFGDRISLETDWQDRAAFADEAAQGARMAKTKIIGSAKYLGLSGSGDTQIIAITLTGATMLLSESGAWELKPCSAECRSYLRTCFQKLEAELVSKGFLNFWATFLNIQAIVCIGQKGFRVLWKVLCLRFYDWAKFRCPKLRF